MTTIAEKFAAKSALFDRAEAVAERKIADLLVYRQNKDIYDKATAAIAELKAAKAAAPKQVGYPVPETPEQAAARIAAEKAAKPPRYLFETVSDLRRMPGQTWLVDRWIPERSVGIIYGRFASGKSFIAFDLLLHLVYGMAEWHGAKLPGVPCHGLLIAREGGSGFKRRVDAFKKHHGIADDTDRIVFMRSPVNFGEPVGFAELVEAIKATGKEFKAVVVDTVGRALPGEDMFDPKSITRFMEHLQQLGEIAQGVAIGIHHENKAGDVMGSIYFDNNSDFMFHVERHGDPASEPLRSGKISCVKQKDGEDGWGRDVAYTFVATEENGEGSLVVDRLTTATAEADPPKPLNPAHTNMLETLREAIREHGSAGKVHVDKWRDVAYNRGFIEGDNSTRSKKFGNLKNTLIANGRIQVDKDMVTLRSTALKPLTPTVTPSLPSNAVPMPPAVG
jgi:hypothetical protein